MKSVNADELDLRWEPETKGITWKICDGGETLREFGPTVKRIFGSNFGSFVDWPPPKFLDPTWKILFVYGNAYSSDATYSFESGHPLGGRDHLEPLWRILEEDGTSEVIITERFRADEFRSGTRSQWQDTIVCAPERKVVRTAISASSVTYQIGGTFMFPRDGRWLMFDDHENFGVLGGEPELIDRFSDYYGGLKSLQKITAYLVSSNIEHQKFYSQDYEGTREFWREMYGYADWPWPEELNEI